MSLNRACILGHLGADPTMRTTASNQRVGTLSVATDSKWTDKDGKKQVAREWHKVIVWGRLASIAEMYLKKGRQVYIDGRIQTREWQDTAGRTRYSFEIVALNLQLIGAKPSDAPASSEPESADAALSPEIVAELEKF